MSECVKIAKKYFSQRKISTVCRILGVSRSSYYRQAKEQKEEEKQLEQRIISTFAKHKGNYGRIRIKKALEREHIKVSEWKIARIMKENGLIAKGDRKKGRGKRSKMVQQEKIIKQMRYSRMHSFFSFKTGRNSKGWSFRLHPASVLKSSFQHGCCALFFRSAKVVFINGSEIGKR